VVSRPIKLLPLPNHMTPSGPVAIGAGSEICASVNVDIIAAIASRGTDDAQHGEPDGAVGRRSRYQAPTSPGADSQVRRQDRRPAREAPVAVSAG
jgi:hypothetical protein